MASWAPSAHTCRDCRSGASASECTGTGRVRRADSAVRRRRSLLGLSWTLARRRRRWAPESATAVGHPTRNAGTIT
eukprot:7390667-Prymnesium_polylepis.1